MTGKLASAKASDRVMIFKLLADHSRYRAIALLLRTRSGMSVGDIAESLGMSHSTTSHLLAVLHEKDIVSYHRRGREMRYEIAKNQLAKRVARLIQLV